MEDGLLVLKEKVGMTADCPGCGLDKAVNEVLYLSGKKLTVKNKSCDPCMKAGILVCLTCQYAHPAKVKSCKSCSQENKKRKANALIQAERSWFSVGQAGPSSCPGHVGESIN